MVAVGESTHGISMAAFNAQNVASLFYCRKKKNCSQLPLFHSTVTSHINTLHWSRKDTTDNRGLPPSMTIKHLVITPTLLDLHTFTVTPLPPPSPKESLSPPPLVGIDNYKYDPQGNVVSAVRRTPETFTGRCVLCPEASMTKGSCRWGQNTLIEWLSSMVMASPFGNRSVINQKDIQKLQPSLPGDGGGKSNPPPGSPPSTNPSLQKAASVPLVRGGPCVRCTVGSLGR